MRGDEPNCDEFSRKPTIVYPTCVGMNQSGDVIDESTGEVYPTCVGMNR